MLLQEIEAQLAIRNSSDVMTKMSFVPICEIEYEDGAKMTTVVGIFYSSSDQTKLEQCHFDALDFLAFRSGHVSSAPVRISVPKLTPREFKKLESQLPLLEGQELNCGTIPPADGQKFAALYRYFPSFAVLES